MGGIRLELWDFLLSVIFFGGLACGTISRVDRDLRMKKLFNRKSASRERNLPYSIIFFNEID